jgi:hypothetical protein
MSNLNERVQEILVANELDFRIEKVPLVAHLPITSVNSNGEIVNDVKLIPTNEYGLLNTKINEVIHTVKEGYTVSQNEDVVKMVLLGMEKFGSQLSVHKAGSLNDGRRIFIQLAIEGESKVGDDILKKYVTIIDSNDGSTGLSVGIGDFTMSCANQFFKFYREGSKMRHTTSLSDKMSMIPSLIEMSLSDSIRTIETYKRMVGVGINDKTIDKLVGELVGLSRIDGVKVIEEASAKKVNAMNTLYQMIALETAQKGRNVWGLHSGVTRWTTHEKSAPRRTNGRLESIMVSSGTNYKVNEKSFEFSKQLIGV